MDYKGIGIYNSYTGFLNKKKIMCIFSNEIKLAKYLEISTMTNIQHETNIKNAFQHLKSYCYENVILDSSFVETEILATELQKFREWESALKYNHQPIDLLIWNKQHLVKKIELITTNVNNVKYVN